MPFDERILSYKRFRNFCWFSFIMALGFENLRGFAEAEQKYRTQKCATQEKIIVAL